jgi:competence protein ComEC
MAVFPGRRIKSALAIATAVLLALLLWHPFPPDVAPGQLELSAIDVGQGDSLLVVFPAGKLMVMDGGGIAGFGRRTKSQIEIGEDVVSPYLWQRSIRVIDVLALTHAHEDHIGGLGALLENFHVKELWTGATPDSPSWNMLRAHAQHNGVKIVAMCEGRRFTYGGAGIEVLGPPRDYIPGNAPRNNDSLALRLKFGVNSFLLSGDMEKQVEAELAGDGALAQTDVLKVAHHGSRTSSTAAFLDLVRPSFAVISAGYENSYGHPHSDVLARLAERHVTIFRTDRDGLVSIRSDGRRIRVETGHSAAPAAGLYSVF